jgi:hypothetical protein
MPSSGQKIYKNLNASVYKVYSYILFLFNIILKHSGMSSTKITHYVVSYVITGLSESINIWVTYLGIHQRLSHDGVNRIVARRPSFVQFTSRTQISDNYAWQCFVIQAFTFYWLSSVNMTNDVSEISGFHGREYDDNFLY